ncbi:EI24 domain-containing protein [Spirilliplanes yamanashiensis]|uniref:Membrane protein n=1 Tax=Spirilliplanes yamanashiensis TaxID=42233 RepID=A0A8J4DI70_9ACTN|nr:EI24 domain-containing protein [Spirilliplanes yamanashiensis]MDP9814432.1 CysZ protein [Spirilliplanes yamanashiensis]GIJ02084.1 membrane protein [Spirilliplanes yamanashiensis]
MGDTVRQFFAGVGLLGRGLALYLRNPSLIALGIVPALISGVLYAAGIVTLVYFLPDLASAVTWFADDWTGWLRSATRFVAGAALLGLGGVLGVVTFTALTLIIGDPFYEKISERVEARFGGVPDEVEVSWHRSLGRSVLDALRLVALSALVGLPLFAAGFVPLVGQTVVPVLAACVAGWFLAVELSGVPFQRRGKRLADRRRALRTQRPVALGFGVAVFLCFLVPLGAVLLTPAAVAGATLLSRRVLGLPTSEEEVVAV